MNVIGRTENNLDFAVTRDLGFWRRKQCAPRIARSAASKLQKNNNIFEFQM